MEGEEAAGAKKGPGVARCEEGRTRNPSGPVPLQSQDWAVKSMLTVCRYFSALRTEQVWKKYPHLHEQ